MSKWLDLENLLIQYRDINIQIFNLLDLYSRDIAILITKINKSSYEESDDFFNELFHLQDDLATVFYKYDFKMPEKLYNFMYDFDRQDEVSKKFWYDKIKKGEYVYDK